MHFPELSEIGHDYAGEEGSEGKRRPALDRVAAKLRQLELDLEAALPRTGPAVREAVPGRFGGAPKALTVKQRVAFFQGGAGQGRRAGNLEEVNELRNKIEAEKAKLQRQGAILRPDGTIDWGLSAQTVVYDTNALAQGLTQLHYSGGRIFVNANCTTPFDTRDMVTHFGGKGWAIYVMSAEGNIHASAHSVGHRHHSSLLGGANVAGAGEMRVLNGSLMEISNKSGHYMPSAAHLLQVLYLLQKRGVSLFATKVNFLTQTEKKFPSVGAFITKMKADGLDTDYEFTKLMAYLTMMTYPVFQPLAATNGWRWGLPPDFFPGAPAQGGRGVVSMADGSQITHRAVRKWLKTQGYALPSRVQTGIGR